MKGIIRSIRQGLIDRNQFRDLYRCERYEEAARFLSEHPQIGDYLSRREKLMMTKTYLDRLSIKLDESARDHEKFRLEIFAIKFGHAHRN